jgi:hypothetical protein
MRRLALLVLCLAAVSCAHTQPSDPNRIEAKGTVSHQEMEGGFYGLVADDGAKYDPGTLPAEFQKDGLRVRFVARKTGAMTMRMWGTAVAVESIEKL